MVAQSLRAKQCITGITINAKAENLWSGHVIAASSRSRSWLVSDACAIL
jgi:hypothetical protein